MRRIVSLGVVVLALVGADMATARQNFQHIWKQDRSFFGAKGQPMPRMQVRPGRGYMSTDAIDSHFGNPLLITVSPGARRGIKRGNPGARNAFEHELARVYQSDSVKLAASPSAGSGVANAVANRLAHFRNTGKGNPKRYNRKHLPYFGQNPRTIRWPPVS